MELVESISDSVQTEDKDSEGGFKKAIHEKIDNCTRCELIQMVRLY